jgi:hypothetical protein
MTAAIAWSEAGCARVWLKNPTAQRRHINSLKQTSWGNQTDLWVCEVVQRGVWQQSCRLHAVNDLVVPAGCDLQQQQQFIVWKNGVQ